MILPAIEAAIAILLLSSAAAILLTTGFWGWDGRTKLAHWRASRLEILHVKKESPDSHQWSQDHPTYLALRLGKKTLALVYTDHHIYYADTGLMLQGAWHDAVKDRVDGWLRMKRWGAFSPEMVEVQSLTSTDTVRKAKLLQGKSGP